MLNKLIKYFLGSYTYTVAAESTVSAVNVLKDSFAEVVGLTSKVDFSYSFSCDYFTSLRISAAFDSVGVSYSVSELKGFPKVLKFLLHRPGIALGIVLIFVLSYFSARVIWGFDVVGNVTVPDEEILMLLDDLGCGYGDYIPTMDLDRIHAQYLATSDNISWISVNLKGNFATVEVIETKKGAADQGADGVYANIVATEDAEIYLVKCEAGVPAVDIGKVVRKGELLISGIIGVKEDRVRYEYAKGEVLAYVPRTIEVKVPFEREKKVFTGEKKTEKSVKIFKKFINLFSKGGIEYTVYDKIVDERQISLFGKFPLPVWTRDVTYKEYEYVPEIASSAETVAYAAEELKVRLDDILADSELISNKVSYEVTEKEFIIRYDMLCLTDIGRVSEFTVDGYTGSSR